MGILARWITEGVGHGDRGHARAEARTGARLARCAARRRAALRRAQLGRAAVGVSLAGALALATHSPNDPSLSTAAGGPPANWLGQRRRLSQRPAAAAVRARRRSLFLPVIAIAGLRMSGSSPAGGSARGLLLAAVGAVLLGIALGLTSGSAVRACPAAGAERSGSAAAHGVDCGVGLIANPQVAGPAAAGRCCCCSPRRDLALGYLALGLRAEENAAGSAACSARRPRERSAEPRRTEIREEAPRRGRATAGRGRRSRSPSRPGAGRRGPRHRIASPAPPAQPGARRQLPAADHRPPRRRRREEQRQQIDRAGLERNARLLETRARGFQRARRHRRGSSGTGRDDVRARAGERDQGEPGHRSWPTTSPATCRRCRRGSRPSRGAA